MTEDIQRVFDAGREIGAMTEAIRTLQQRFTDFEHHVPKRCTDCSMNGEMATVRENMQDHERRLRWVERKMYGAIALTGLVVYFIDKVIPK